MPQEHVAVADRATRLLVWSKLQAPVQRRWVHRPAPLRLCTEPARKLTLIRAPAGWGKSTLLAEWHATQAESRRFAWLALDRGDNDPVRFWTYLIEALRTQHPQAGSVSLRTLEAPRVDVVRDVLPALNTELATLPRKTVLVLDDYHLVTNPEIDEALASFVDHLPQALELAVASRTEPALPLARLRGRGELVEIDARDLYFSTEDAEQLFNDLQGLALDHDAVSRLQERTEGWAAGLCLASLTLRGRSDVDRFIAAFAGDDRHVVDYLSAEVLADQPDDLRSFMLRTSLLDRLCASLCDAVTGRQDSRQVLRELETSNSFLVPLDTRREWYRYHHLFAELLRQELRLSQADQISAVHHRAAAWHREHGSASEAIQHATAAGDLADASELILEHWTRARDHARLETVLGWLAGLPAEFVRRDPRLCLVYASTLQEIGRIVEADQWLATAERAGSLDALIAGPDSVAVGLAACRAINRYFLGDAAGIRRTAAPALEQTSPTSAYWTSALLTTLGAAQFVLGRNADAADSLRRAIESGEDSGHALALVHALGWSAVVHLENGERDRAGRVLRRIDSLLAEHVGLTAYYGAAMVHLARGTLRLQDGDLAQAAEELARGSELAWRGSARFEQVYGLVGHARLAARLDDRPTALAQIGQARAAVHACVDPGVLPDMIARTERALHGMPTSSRQRPYPEALSDRELAVLRLLPSDLTQREIAARLNVSFNTVKSHMKSIYRKLDVPTRREAVALAREHRLI